MTVPNGSLAPAVDAPPPGVEPWPLATRAAVRALAWPRWDDPRDLAAVAAVLEGAVLPAQLCLCLRFDPAQDGDLAGALASIERALAPPARAPRALEILVVDDALSPADWPRLGRAVSFALRLPSSREGERAAFVAATARPVLETTWSPRQRNDMRHQVFLTRAFAEAIEDPAARLEFMARFVAAVPRYRPALAVQGQLLLEAGRLDEAAKQLQACLAIGYDDVEVQRLFLEATGRRSPLRERAGLFCNMPFTDFEILDNGDVYPCSNVNLPFPVGNVLVSSWEDIWSSPAAQEVRRSILDGDFRYCAPMTCPLQHGLPRRDRLPAEDRAFVEQRRLVVPEGPRRVALAYDRSCNLRCPSCRTGPIMSGRDRQRSLDELADRVVLPLLERAQVAHITGSGDPFGSPHYRRVLRALTPARFPHLVVDMMTNGMLLDAGVWDGELKHLHGRMREIAVSLDGATAATYDQLRPGGDFATVCANLAHLARARRAGELDRLVVNMVVQACNFREIGDLVRLCLGWGVDQVRFYKLRQWGTYPEAEFLARDVVNPRHPLHAELLHELGDPILREGIVSPFELSHLIPRREGSQPGAAPRPAVSPAA